jgi:hypothetical protein
LDYVATKNAEPVLTGNIGSARSDLMGEHAEGSASILARPDDIGLILLAALGKEAYASNSHTFTPATQADNLPSITVAMDKQASTYTYSGCKINTLSFSASPEDYLSMDFDIVSYNEVVSSTRLTAIAVSTLKAFKFKQGQVFSGTAGATAGTAIADVSNISFNYNNNLEATVQTTSTGTHYKEPTPNTREASADLDIIYSADAETFRTSYYKADTPLSLKLYFESDEPSSGTKYSLSIEIPNCQMTEASVPVSDANHLTQSCTLTAFDDGTSSFVKVILYNNKTSAY